MGRAWWPAGRPWWPTALLCLATAFVTWSATTVVHSLGAEPPPDDAAAVYAPPVPPEPAGPRPSDQPRAPRSSALTGAGAHTGTGSGLGTIAAPATAERSRAVHITIPALHLDQNLVELAVNGDSLQVPDRYSDVGWWRDGPTPGDTGAAVVVGHVDSPTGPAVFYQLSGMVRGERILVRLDDGSRQVFKVRQAVLYDRDHFPSSRVYRERGRPGLNLLTCGGSFDHAVDAYRGNVVVYTDLVKRLPAKAGQTHPHQEHQTHPAPSTSAH